MATLPACPTVTVSSQGLEVRMPGGPTLQVMTPEIGATPLQVTKNLLTQANAALAPLAPVFAIIDAVLAVKDFATTVPKVLTNPSKVVTAVTKVVEKASALAALVPQLAVPLMAVDILDVVITALEGVIVQLEAVVVQEAQILAAATKATETGNDALLEITVCAEGVLTQVRDGISEGLTPLNSLFSVLNLFLGLVPGAPTVPSLDALPDDAQEAIDTLRDLVGVLEQVRDSIPIP